MNKLLKCILLLYVLQSIGKTLAHNGKECSPEVSGYSIKHCPDGWVRYKQEKCFKLFQTNKQTWEGESEVCKQLNSNLASIHSKDEVEFLISYYLAESSGESNLVETWIGAFKRGSFWTWLDHSPFDWADWQPGHPKEEPPCVYLVTEYQNLNNPLKFGKMSNWGHCNHSLNFICQKFVLDTRTVVYSK